jgi:hydroxymethylpyrimidine/phosphomethylpyrimidine kinase
MSAVRALTSQNTVEVRGVVEIDPAFVSSQIHAVVYDIGVDAVMTGMLANSAIIAQVAKDVGALGIDKLVVDPVMVAKSGDPLLRRDAVETLVRELLPKALVVTPNTEEASVLAGSTVDSPETMRDAARKIKDFGPGYVLIKGGHLKGQPMDLLFDGIRFREFTNVRYDTPHTHGTGCTFASAIAAGLARGLLMEEAVARAKAYITGAIRQGLAIGKGHGPVHHFHELYRLAGWCCEES